MDDFSLEANPEPFYHVAVKFPNAYGGWRNIEAEIHDGKPTPKDLPGWKFMETTDGWIAVRIR